MRLFALPAALSILLTDLAAAAVVPTASNVTETVGNATETVGNATTTVPQQVVNSTLNTTCYSGVRLFVARGTLETQGESAQEVYVQKILDTVPDSYSSEIVYPAAPFWFPLTFISSVLTGISNAQTQIYDYHRQCPDSKIVVMGYSQGARVMGHAISGSSLIDSSDPQEPINVPMQPLCASAARQVVAVVLFGDPGRKIGLGEDAYASASCNVSATYPRKGSQLANFEPFADRLQEWCNKSDPVCCASGKQLAAHVSYFAQNFTATQTEVVAQFVKDKASLSQSDVSQLNASSCVPFQYNPLITRDLRFSDEEEFAKTLVAG